MVTMPQEQRVLCAPHLVGKQPDPLQQQWSLRSAGVHLIFARCPVRAAKDTWTGCSALLWRGAGSVPLASSHSQSCGSGSAEQGKKGVNGTAHLLPGQALCPCILLPGIGLSCLCSWENLTGLLMLSVS